jgi:intermembrane space import and assembly protein 40
MGYGRLGTNKVYRGMQDCFRRYPEVYGSELESDAADDEDELTADAAHADSRPASRSTASTGTPSVSQSRSDPAAADKGKQSGESSSKPYSPEKITEERPDLGLVPGNYKPDAQSDTERANQAAAQVKSQEPVSESESLVPKAAHDTRDENTRVQERK